jgi:ribosomal protein S18 acetylase RimI-like enzyme
MKLITRWATMQDYDALCRIIDEVDAMHQDNLPHIFQKPAGPARDRDYVLSLIENDEIGLFVAEIEGIVVGFASVIIGESKAIPMFVPRRLAIVDNIAVRTEFRGAGIGRALMDAVHEWAAAAGAATVELNVYEFNQAAIEFYHSLGYRTLSRKMEKSLQEGEHD